MTRVVIAPDSFKGVLDAPAVANAIAYGVRRARPNCDIVLKPMADGGEGTLDVLVDADGGNRRRARVTGPLGEPVDTVIGLIRQATTAVVELAKIAGFSMVPPNKRNPLVTTTYGIGEILRTIIDSDIEEIILAVGGSATVDGGMGLMQGLGVTFLDRDGRIIKPPSGGGDLERIKTMVWDKPPANLENVRITIACDVFNPACGPNGAAAIFGPQKGADAATVKRLDRGLSHWADVLEAMTGRPIREEPGTGAAGAVALPLLAMTNASLTPGVDLVCEANDLIGAIGSADLVITGEGRLDRQSMMGKVVGAVGRMSQAVDVPCAAITGVTGGGADDCLEVIATYRTLNAPLEQTAQRLSEVAAQLVKEML